MKCHGYRVSRPIRAGGRRAYRPCGRAHSGSSPFTQILPLSNFKVIGSRDMAHAVEDTSLILSAGRALALVGESGSGKTTVACMLARLYEPTAGTINNRGVP